MKTPGTTSVHKAHKFFALTFLVLLILLLLAPAERLRTSVKAQAQESQRRSYANLSSEQAAELNALYRKLKAGEPFSEEEKYILRRFAAGVQISELEGRVVSNRILYDYYVTNNQLTADNRALLDEYNSYATAEHHFVEDVRIKLKADIKARELEYWANPKSANSPTAGPPANDNCSGALGITDTQVYPITTTAVDVSGATATSDPTLCGITLNNPTTTNTIWYTFVPAINATYTITTCPTTAPGTTLPDTVLGIFTSSGGCAGVSNTALACNDDDSNCSNGSSSTISAVLTAGTTYYIVAGKFNDLVAPSPGSSSIQLAITRTPVPANDLCGSAIPLTLDSALTGQTTVGANTDYQLSGTTCFSGFGDNSVGNTSTTADGRDVVYSFTAASAASYSFRVTKFGNSLNPVIYVATSCPGGTPPITVTCSNTTGPAIAGAHRVNGNGAQEIPCLPLSGGQTVYLIVDEGGVSAGSLSFTVEVNKCSQETEPNDTPATATIGTEGSIGSDTDVDFYLLGAPAAGSRVFAMVDGIAANSTDFDMRVTTATDTLEFDNNDADTLFGSQSAVIGGTLLTGVGSYLRLSHGSFIAAGTGPYRLYTKVQPAGSADTPNCGGIRSSATAEVEPNNIIAQANTAGNNYFYGSLLGPAPSTDVDYYSFTANAGDLIFVALDGDPCLGSALNAALELRNSTDSVPALVAVNDADGTTCTAPCNPTAGNLAGVAPVAPAEALVFRATYTGTYFARVSTGTSSSLGVGDYLLSISVKNDHGPTAADSSIAGRVTGTTGEPLAGVTMVLTSGSGTKQTTTNADGEYSFPDLETGDFFVVGPARGNYNFTPAKRPFSLRSKIKNANFTANAVWAQPDRSAEATGLDTLNNSQNSQSSNGQSTEHSWAAALPESARRAALNINPGSLTIQQQIAAGSAAKIQVRNSGWYRINQPDLIAAGLDPGANARMLQLYVDGEEVPIRLSSEGAHFNPSDTLEFYGVGLDTPTTDTRTYWLINGSSPGQRISGRRNKVAPSYIQWPDNSAVPNFAYTTERKEKLIYFPNLLNGDAENIFGSLVMTEPATQNLTIKSFDQEATAQPELEIALQGVTPLNHQVQVKLNGSNVGTITFKSREHSVTKLLVDRNLLCEGNNIVSLAASGGDSDISLVDWVRLTYARRYVAENNALQFSVPGGQAVRVTGFTNPNIRVVDVTNPKAVTEIDAPTGRDGTGYLVRLQTKGSETRSLLAFSDDRAESPTVTANQRSSWNLSTNAADLLIVTHKNFRQSIEPLAELRRSQGLRVAVVDVDDVYDEFSYGAHTPAALKGFLSWAANHWAGPPQYLLMVGDSSWDPRNYFGEGDNDFVPTKLIDTLYMETASDDWVSDFNGTGMPNIAIGRLPARTVEDANLMVSKILVYEQERQSGAPLRGAVLVADSGFESESSLTRTLLPSGITVQAINRSVNGDDDLTRNQIIEALNQGPMLVNYYGHGNVGEWTGAGLFENDLASGLTNTNRLSLFVMMTCLNGYAHDAYIDSLGESALKAPEGGAMAVWASSGLTEPSSQFAMSTEFYRQIFGTEFIRLGTAIRGAKAATTDRDVRRTWILLGDPTSRLR